MINIFYKNMRGAIIIILISVLLAGCAERYVCEDGSVVSDRSMCPKEEVKIEIVEEPEEEIIIEEAEEEEKKVRETVFGEFEGNYYNVELQVKDRGITLRFLGFYYIKKGEDFGKITGVKYKIINEGVDAFTPSLRLTMVNNERERDPRTADVERGEIEISVGEEAIEEAPVSLSFNRLDTEKTLGLEIYDSYVKGEHMFTVEAKKDFSGLQ
ncbi:hypothetical protein KY345_06085 [Candidatus Woesearchaeota archaeon]|nr:hypothetical protein [Candidatus Woesearchaeota archaeon]